MQTFPGRSKTTCRRPVAQGATAPPASCRLLFDPAQIEGHFQRQSQNRLTRREIGRVLKALREMAQRFARNGEIIVSVDDLMRRAGIPSGHEGRRADTGHDRHRLAGGSGGF